MTNRVGVVLLVDGGILSSMARALIDDLFASPESKLETIGAAEALRELRVDSGA